MKGAGYFLITKMPIFLYRVFYNLYLMFLTGESLLLEIDMSDEFLQTWLSTLTFRFATLMYETIFIASFSGTIGKFHSILECNVEYEVAINF